MAFGLGERYEETRPEEPVRRQIEIACECWFTSQGRTMPLMIKFQDECGKIRQIKNILVKHVEMKRYAGVSALEYDCDIPVWGTVRNVRLVFYVEHCRWVMCL